MGKVQKSTATLGPQSRAHAVIRAALRNDSAPANKPNKPNRKFQLALQGLNKQHNSPKAKQEPKIEARPAPQTESAAKLSFTHGSRGLAKAEPSTISFIRNSPKSTPSDAHEAKSSKVNSSRHSGYRASPLGQPPSPQPSLSFVRTSKPESETPRNLRENKDRRAVAANGLFMRNISDIGNQNAREKRMSTPYSRPDSLKSNPKPTSQAKVSLLNSIREILPPADASTSETTPSRHLTKGSEPKVEKPKPAMSIFDRLGTNKRRRSPSCDNEVKRRRSPSPVIKAKRRRSPSPDHEVKRRRSPSPVNDAKHEKLAPKPKRNSQMSSRLGPLSRNEPQRSLPLAPSVRSRLGHQGSNSARHGNQGYSSQAFRPPRTAPYFVPQQYRQEQKLEVQQEYLHQDYYDEYQQPQGYQEYPVHMSQAHPAYPQQPGYPLAPQQQQHAFPANAYYPNLYMPRRCQYFPRCAREDCKFFHPVKNCPNEDDCLDENCLFIHPADKKPIMCIYDAACTRVDCKFEHVNRRLAVGDPDRYLPIKCEGDCVGRACPFIHPNDKLPHENTLCIFAARCNRPPCSYLHMSTYRKKPAKKATTVTELMAAYKSVMLDSDDSDDDDED